MTQILIVSSADSAYFPLLCEWRDSLRQTLKDFTFQIGIINAGLTQDQTAALLSDGCIVAEADWPCPIPEHKLKGRDFLKACVARPFIPDIFPGFETYIWMDADTWLQTPEAIDLMIQGAAKNKLAIVSQADRAYGKAMRLGWLGPFPWRPRSFYYSNAKRAFDGKTARALFPYPALNAGIFALKQNAPHWKRWQELIVKALDKGKVFTAEQLTLGMLIYLEKYEAELLPAWCNWLCQTKPLWDDTKMRFVEPYLPHHPISVMHLSTYDQMRKDASILTKIQTLSGQSREMSLRFKGSR